EFDQTWGHRNDVAGFHEGLRELDAWIPRLEGRVREDDLIIITADHGNDPTTPSTDHSREAVPVLALGPRVRARGLGERATFADLGATVAEYFGVARLAAGSSFLKEVWAWEPPASPCGACRQLLAEFGLDLEVIAVGPQSERRWTLAALLPDAFAKASLDR